MDTPGDVLELLTRQHHELEDLLQRLVDEERPAQRASILARAGDDLAVHIAAEEAVFYPAVRAVRTEDILLESLEEHLSLKRLLADLLALAPDDPTFGAKAKVLQEQSEHHHDEEEEHLFPKVALLIDVAQRARLAGEVRDYEAAQRAGGAPRMAVKGETDAAETLPPSQLQAALPAPD